MKWLLFLAVSLSFTVSYAQGVTEVKRNIYLSCPVGWILKGTSCYKIVDLPATWLSARQTCNSEGAELVSIHDSVVNTDVGSLVFTGSASLSQFWIGLIVPGDVNATSQETLPSYDFGIYNASDVQWWDAWWSKGQQTLLFEGFWDISQPNTTAGDCVYVQKNAGGEFKWSLDSCEQKKVYVCQLSACSAGSFHCSNSKCINQRWTCDGIDDCGDYSDEINCSSRCHYHLSGSGGYIQSPNYPFQYGNNSNCLWLIEGPQGSNIKLEFSVFSTEYRMDEVLIFVGGKTPASSQYADRLSGDLSSSLPTFISTNNFLIVMFHSDSDTLLGRNFKAQWTAITQSIPPDGQVLMATDNPQEFSSPFYSQGFYLQNQDIFWIIKPSRRRSIITLQVLDIDLNEGDLVIVRDGNQVQSTVLATYTTTSTPNIVISTYDLHITMRTGLKYHQTPKRGFKFMYTEGCAVHKSDDAGILYSPGYGTVNYANYQNCSWQVETNLQNRVTVIFEDDFDLEDDKDFLQVYIVNGTMKQVHPQGTMGYTGTVAPPSFSAQSGKFVLNLQTDSIRSRRGYRAKYSVGCPDPRFNSYTDMSISTVYYDYGIKFNVTCQSGYTFDAEEFVSESYVEMECLYGGKWNVRRIPQCRGEYCGPPPLVDNGYISQSSGVTYGSTVTYICLDGFSINGNNNISCKDDGTWETPPLCESVNCPQISSINNGYYNVSGGNGTEFASLLTYSCNQGYEVNGTAILFCLPNGTWSQQVPSCQKLKCLVPAVSYGIYNQTVSSFVEYGDVLSLTCDDGFVSRGSSEITCGADQKFGILPYCEDVDECRSGNNCTAVEVCSNSIGSYKCGCISGYMRNATSGVCEDIDECLDGTDHCDMECTNAPRSYICGCLTGFVLYVANGTENFFIPDTETGLLPGDRYHLNHSCVLNSCPPPPMIDNGFILNRRIYYHYLDSIVYRCNLGYILNDSSSDRIRCQSDGSWDKDFPQCLVAECPPDPPELWQNVTKPPVYSMAPVQFMDFLNMTCDVLGRGQFVKTRQCIYDSVTNKYSLNGDTYECGEDVDCGVPIALPGAITSPYSGTSYGSSFNISCDNFFSLHGVSSDGDNVVTCSSNGYWDYGSLRCLPASCPGLRDPLGGSQIGTGFTLGSMRVFQCDRPGYVLSDWYPLQCIASADNSSLVWNGTVPTCSDETPPVISGCPSSNVAVRRYQAAWSGTVRATDNSGRVANFTIEPYNFSPSNPVENNVTVVYTATDDAGYVANCQVYVRVIDEEPPVVICPQSYNAYFENYTDFQTITISAADFLVTDNSGSIHHFSFQPNHVNVSMATWKNVYTITATATDHEGNSGSCRYEIMVRATTCLPVNLIEPINGRLNCTERENSTGYRCEVRCNDGYYFYENYGNDVFVTECEEGGNWTDAYIPSCIDTSDGEFCSSSPSHSAVGLPCPFDEALKTEVLCHTPADSYYRQVHELIYSTQDNNTLIPTYCMNIYRILLNGLMTQASRDFTDLCRLAAVDQARKNVSLSSVDITADTDQLGFVVNYTVKFSPENLVYDDTCVSDIRLSFFFMTNVIDILSKLTNVGGGCPDVNGLFSQTHYDEPDCVGNVNFRKENLQKICLACPAGSFLNINTNQCELCPIGTYSTTQGQTSCTECPPGKSTYTTGNTALAECSFMCLTGSFTSANGLPPCSECVGNTYRSSPTTCVSCPSDTLYTKRDSCRTGPCTYTKIENRLNTGVFKAYAGSIQECEDFCENLVNTTFVECVGFSYRKALSICYAHYDLRASIDLNLEYDFYERNCPTLSLEACHCYDECDRGFVSYRGFEPCYQCPYHYYSNSTQSTSCAECPLDTLTLGPGRTSSSFCESADTLCTPGRCQNNGTCRIGNHGYICDCPTGFTGRDCESRLDYCASQPCYFGGTCVNNIDGFTCSCLNGILGNQCETEPDNCQPSPCQNGGVCQDGVLNYSCACLPGYRGRNCELSIPICDNQPCLNGATCQSIDNVRRTCVCATGFTGQDCRINIDDCDSSPCLNGGTCQDGVASYTCSCPAKYTGSRCETPKRSCSTMTCANADGCYDDIQTADSFCICQPGYTIGLQCQYVYTSDTTRVDVVAAVYASVSLAQCVQICDNFLLGQSSCQAFAYHADRTCNLYTVKSDGYDQQTTPGSTYYEKSCYPVYDDFWTTEYNIDSPASDGTDNETRINILANNFDVCGSSVPMAAICQPADFGTFNASTYDSLVTSCSTDGFLCKASDQPLNQSCEDFKVSFKCPISEVYGRNTCQLVDYCKMYSPCLQGGVCRNVFGGYDCTCPAGYGGSICQHNIDDCASHPCLNGGTCTDGSECATDINECQQGPCSSVGTQLCNNTDGSYECVCKPGYSGQSCSVDVNECESDPCLHGGQCVDIVNGYSCTCESGWTGQRCEMLLQYCSDVADPCLNAAECRSLFNDYFCMCPTNTQGRQCKSMSDMCSRLNPCLNNGTCSYDNAGAMYSCQCGNGNSGSGCQTFVDYDCSTDLCYNNGHCQNLPGGNGFTCSCSPGYTGLRCEVEIDECSSSPCPITGTCIDGLDQYFCRCPVSKEEPDCLREIDRDFDLIFTSSNRASMAYLPYGISVNPTQFALSFWARFSKAGGKGTFVSVFEQSAPGWRKDINEIFSLDHEGLHIDLNGSQEMYPYSYFQVNDGHWHFMVVMWDSVASDFSVVVDTIRLVHLQNYNVGRLLDMYYWVSLGSSATPSSVGNAVFEGYISQLNMYSRILEFIIEIPRMYQQPYSRDNFGDLLQWAELRLRGLVRRIQPSTILISPITSTQDKSSPMILSCPGNIYTPSIHTWAEPVFQGATVVRTNKRLGEKLPNGKNTVIYEGQDDFGNTALCIFNVYINDNNCSSVSEPASGGTQTCYTQGWPFQACSISCPAKNYTISQLIPRFYTCGPVVSWYGLEDQSGYFQYPPCGVITNPANNDIDVRLTYQVSTTVCYQVRVAMVVEVQRRLKNLNAFWDGKLCDQSDCTDVAVNVTCQSADNPLTYVDFTIHDVKSLLSKLGQKMTPEEILTRSVLDSNDFYFASIIPQGSPDPHGFTLTVSQICPVGQVLIDGDCVYCGVGTFYDTISGMCQMCEKGSYQDSEDGTTSCSACPTNETTQYKGSSSLDQCYTICSVGSFYNTTSMLCQLCSIGTYQELSGQRECVSCPFGKTTKEAGTQSQDKCFEECQSGYALSASGTCEICELGFYRTASVTLTCQPCPSGFITSGRGAVSVSECTVVACGIGQYRTGSNTCEDCQQDTYQDDKWQTSCKPCNSSYRTDQAGSTRVTQCKFFCPSGYEISGSSSCSACPIGYYRNNSDGYYGNCQLCPGRRTTPGIATTDTDGCTILICPAGYRADDQNALCELCPIGQYQPLENQVDCLPCQGNSTTRREGATNMTECEMYCPSGYEMTNSGCIECQIGYYKNNSEGVFKSCTKCPVNFVTSGPGAASVDDCSVSDCQAGYKINSNNNGCEACPLGSYQPQKYQTNCILCPVGKSTRNVGASSQSQCESYCPSGQEQNSGQCSPCPVGYYKDNANGVFSSCVVCPVNYITASTGSGSVQDCNIGNCTAGQFLSNSACVDCPVGSYQPDKWQTSCLPCPQFRTTLTTGAFSISMCYLRCDPGYEEVGLSCTKCAIGFYKAQPGVGRCTRCPTGFITAATGATAVTDCNIADCGPGTFLASGSSTCEQCPYGQYQQDLRQNSCISCPAGTTTFNVGATSQSECFLDCNSGYEYNIQTSQCQPCLRGYHRDNSILSQSVCELCPVQYITPDGTLGTSVSDCTIANCTTPGQYRDPVVNQCTDCPVDTYQTTKWQDACVPCSSGYITWTNGASSPSDCRIDCASGYEERNGVCIPCQQGYYRDKGQSFTCQQCPTGFITQGVGSTSASLCDIPDCLEGQYFDSQLLRCQSCPRGQYQPQKYQNSCIVCPDNKYTSQAGSVLEAACISFCSSNKHNCSQDAFCTDSSTQGFQCTCKTGWIGTGDVCNHPCDTPSYCKNNAVCVRRTSDVCICTDMYEGSRCEVRKAAEQASQRVRDVTVGVIVGGIGLVLIIILIIVTTFTCLRRKQTEKRRRMKARYPVSRQPSFVGPGVVKANLVNYGQHLPPFAQDNFAYQGDSFYAPEHHLHDASFITFPDRRFLKEEDSFHDFNASSETAAKDVNL